MDASIAEVLSAVLGTEVRQIDGGYLIKETATHFVTIQRMIYNWRLNRTPKAHPQGADRAYCYYGNDFVTMLRVVAAALNWDADSTEPEGFDKNAMTGEYAHEHLTLFS